MAHRQENFNLYNPDDLAAVHNIIFDDQEIEDNGDETDTDAEDLVEERAGDSETEEEGSEEEDNESEGEHYIGKDKVTKWSKTKPSARIRRGGHNVLLRLPGVVGEARNAKTPYDCWNCFFSFDIIEMIVKYTNIYIQKIQGRFQRERDANVTDAVEFKAFIGLLYLAGVLRSNRQSLEELWGDDGYGVERFRLVMSLKRFKFLIRCTRFDDVNTRQTRREVDKLAAVREIFGLFVTNCQKHYSVGQDVTVDEKLEGFRGRCSFRQYIPSKPNKYGIKIYALVDAKMFYTYTLEIYAGKQPEGPYSVSNKPLDVVSRLAEPIFGTGRNITCDNWFTSLQLLQFLKQKRLSLLGTIRKNKPQLPIEFVNSKCRLANSNKFCFSPDCTLVSYVPRKGKVVLAISSAHHDDKIEEETGKAEVILDYNATKSGVDVVDKLCATYNVARNVRRWPMVIFFSLLNIAGINSEIIFIANKNIGQVSNKRRRLHLKELANELCLEQLQRRSMQSVGLPSDLQLRLQQFRPAPTQNVEQGSLKDGTRQKCYKCKEMRKKRYSRYCCKKCENKVFCLEHACMVCEDCYKSAFEGSQSE